MFCQREREPVWVGMSLSVWEGGEGLDLGEAGGWMPLPTRPQRYCVPASLVVIYSDSMGGAWSHRRRYNSYSALYVKPCSKTRCCVMLPWKHENKHKRERSCTKICSLPMLKSLESTEDF